MRRVHGNYDQRVRGRPSELACRAIEQQPTKRYVTLLSMSEAGAVGVPADSPARNHWTSTPAEILWSRSPSSSSAAHCDRECRPSGKQQPRRCCKRDGVGKQITDAASSRKSGCGSPVRALEQQRPRLHGADLRRTDEGRVVQKCKRIAKGLVQSWVWQHERASCTQTFGAFADGMRKRWTVCRSFRRSGRHERDAVVDCNGTAKSANGTALAGDEFGLLEIKTSRWNGTRRPTNNIPTNEVAIGADDDIAISSLMASDEPKNWSTRTSLGRRVPA